MCVCVCVDGGKDWKITSKYFTRGLATLEYK